MKETAVEWLYKNLLDNPMSNEDVIYNINTFEKAKEMEKQKLEQFYNHGQWAVIENGHGECFEDYYNRIIKQQEQ
jgi:hypothetical protein